MGIINPFSFNEREVKKDLSTQLGAWCLISRGGKKCLFLRAHAAGDTDYKGASPQIMVFEPSHIGEFKKLLKKWDV